MSVLSNADRIGVWGRSGSGKSAYVKQRLRKAKRVVVFDPLDEYSDFERAVTVDQVKYLMRQKWKTFRIAYVPPVGQEDIGLSHLSRFCKAAQQPFKKGENRSYMTLAADELANAFPTHGGVTRCPGWSELCARGRHYGIVLIGASQRLAEVNTRFRANCTETVVFPQKGPQDRKAAALELDCTVQELEGLADLHFIRRTKAGLERGKVTFR